jgi:dTDP-glucose 4,6-dehydratase
VRVLITGGAGFIGSHILEHFMKNTDWDIVVWDKLTYAANGLDRIRDIECFNEKRVLVLTVDFSNPIEEGIIQETGQVDYVLHIAGETHVDRSLQDAIPFVSANVMGTGRILEWAKNTQKNLKKYIQFGTDEVYGAAPPNFFFKEWDTMRPSNPYAATKGGGDLLAYSFAHAFEIPIIISRTMNCYGERQHPEKFLPKTIRAILHNEKVILHGQNKDNLSSRCWIHARNVADALLFLINNSINKDMYHIVGEERNVFEIANIICQEVKGRDLQDSEIEYVDFHQARKGHDKRYAMSGEKLAGMGWKAPLSLEDSLRKTVKWTLENKKWLMI